MVERRIFVALILVFTAFLSGCAGFDGIKMPSYHMHTLERQSEHPFFHTQVIKDEYSQQRIIEPFGSFNNAKRLRIYWGGYDTSYFQWREDLPGCFVTWYVQSSASGSNYSWRRYQPTTQSSYYQSEAYHDCDRFAYNEALRLWVLRGGTLPSGFGPLPN